MERFFVKDLKPEGVFTAPLFLDPKYILLTPEAPVSQSLVRALIQWEFREVLTDGRQKLPDEKDVKGESERAEFDGKLSTDGKGESQEKDMLRKVLDFYQRTTAFVDQIFTRYVTRSELNQQEITLRMREFADFVTANRRWVLRIQDPGAANRNYLVSHSVKTAILSVILGSYLKLPLPKLAELGAAAILHEIGMVRLPPQLYMTDRQLSPQEKKNILSHPVLGYNILKSFNFPLSICLAALEHHERNNGQGYPRAVQADKISAYAKIIAVACSYDAVTSSRPYKEAKDGYDGMLDLLKNEGRQYEDGVVKALVYSLSVYPIGTYVQLSDERMALVVDSNPENPRYPLVRILGDQSGDGATLATSAEGVSVRRALSQRDAAQLLKN